MYWTIVTLLLLLRLDFKMRQQEWPANRSAPIQRLNNWHTSTDAYQRACVTPTVDLQMGLAWTLQLLTCLAQLL